MRVEKAWSSAVSGIFTLVCLVGVLEVAAHDVPRLYSAIDNEPLTGNADFIKSGSGTLWLTAPSNNTFSGDIRIERSGGALELGGNTFYADGEGRAGIALPAMTSASTVTVNPGGALVIKDNANGAVGHLSNRLGSAGDRPALVLNNGSFTYLGPSAAGVVTQSFDAITAASGLSAITVTRNNAASTTILQGGSFTRDSGSHLTLSATAMGTAADNVSQILFTTPPQMVGGGVGIIPGVRHGNNFVTYGDYGLRALLAEEYFETSDINNAGPDDNVKVSAGTFVPLDGNRTINSLQLMLKQNWALGTGNRLTIKSGQVLLTQN